MKDKRSSIKLYAISGYYSTIASSLGDKGQITSYVKSAFSKIVENYDWLILAISILLLLILSIKTIIQKIRLNNRAKELDRDFSTARK
ncbi:hypothetical protein COT12_02530 [Candidatus Berkelbacteria bacterium CG08_land_8_20_14_0_20_39_8]|uniref:Uncharacterized protein n=1 Tax=Candidatus Berkelbacteria bacterium CG08_land_8_20_14_0_20_39_8 TaxID=1974511 RepID=A0A2M6YBV4_9BACT|nr:MAG: hypothetical protein COT12_02530 [Candidatus Berkelbacteria bacterium CG08_land_8_20_14_0_20_39_8]